MIDSYWFYLGTPLAVAITWIIAHRDGFKSGRNDEWHRVNGLFNDFFVLHGQNSPSVRWIYNAMYDQTKTRLAPREDFFPNEEKLLRNA